MKKIMLVALVVLSLLTVAGVASAEHDDVGGVGVKSFRIAR